MSKTRQPWLDYNDLRPSKHWINMEDESPGSRLRCQDKEWTSPQRWIVQELKPASAKLRPKGVMTMTMESSKIEANTPKIPKISAVVQNIEQQVAILLHGKT